MKTNMLKMLFVMAFFCGACQSDLKSAKLVQTESTDDDSVYYSEHRRFSKPIPIDSGNKMIQSYLASIHPEVNQYELKSLIFDANLLRKYLNDSSNGRIENLKMVMAHRLSYINSGHFGQRPDSNSEALTLVLVGYGANGNYIYYNGNQALNVCQPCPRECPEAGTAAGDLLVQ